MQDSIRIIDERYVQFIDWAYSAHDKAGNFYDDKLPYRVHLRLVVDFCKKYRHLIPDDKFDQTVAACAGHDLMEIAGITYYQIKERSSIYTAEIIRAVTPYNRGRNRKEKMPDWIYKEIRETEGAIFTKLCDRLGNVKFGVSGVSSSWGAVEMYRKEMSHFKQELYVSAHEEMWQELENLLASH